MEKTGKDRTYRKKERKNKGTPAQFPLWTAQGRFVYKYQLCIMR